MQETGLFVAFYIILASLLGQKRGALFSVKGQTLEGQ